MKRQPFVSVIVPAYNIEDYIGECIDRIKEQTYSDRELFLVNAGSRDCTGENCVEYDKKNSRIRAIHKESGGIVGARKSGLKEVEGEYIFCVDEGDWLIPDALELLHECGIISSYMSG